MVVGGVGMCLRNEWKEPETVGWDTKESDGVRGFRVWFGDGHGEDGCTVYPWNKWTKSEVVGYGPVVVVRGHTYGRSTVNPN